MRNMASIKAKAQADSSPVRTEKVEAKKRWKKAQAAKAVKAALTAASNAENKPRDDALPPLQDTREGASVRASLERVKASRSATQKDALERMLANAKGLSEESHTQLSNLLFDLKQHAIREQDVNSSWTKLRQSKSFQQHIEDRESAMSPLAQRQGGAARSPLEPSLESNALAQWNQIKGLKSVKSLSKGSSLAKLLQDQAEASAASKAPGGAEWDEGDGVYKDADAFRRAKSSKWNKARALGTVKGLIETKDRSSDDGATDGAAQAPEEEEPLAQDDSYGIKIPKTVMEREMLRQNKERHLGHAARQTQKLRMKKLHTMHKHGHHGPLVEYGSRFEWHDLCVAASTFAFKGLSATQPDQDGENTDAPDKPLDQLPDRAAERPPPTKQEKKMFRWKLGMGHEVSDLQGADHHAAAPQSLPPVVPSKSHARGAGEKNGANGDAAGGERGGGDVDVAGGGDADVAGGGHGAGGRASPVKKAVSLGALGNKMGWLLQSRRASLQ